jgi:hypothetical protein
MRTLIKYKKQMGWHFFFKILLIIVICIPLIWPNDAPFINDEPKFFLLALKANNEHKLAEAGFVGSVGLPYGPIAIWIYQLLISITTVPANWIVLRAGFMLASIALGLFLLLRATGLWKWFIPIILVSPYIWFYSRHLWDNSFLLAFSTLAIGGYSYFLVLLTSKKRLVSFDKNHITSKRSNCPNFLYKLFFLLSFTAVLILPFIHFMAIPLSLTLFLHMSMYGYIRKFLPKVLLPIILILGFFIISHLPYFHLLLANIKNFELNATDGAHDSWKGWLFPILGGKLLSGRGLNYFFGNHWLPNHPVYLIMQRISYIGYVLVFLGIFIAGKNVWDKRMMFKKAILEKVLFDIRIHLSLIALISIILQIIVCGVSHSYHHPHYYNGIWIVHVIFAWLAVEQIVRKKWGKLIISMYGVSLIAILLTVIILVHQRSGARGFYYGPTIGNQLEITRKIGFNKRNDLNFTVENFKEFPSLKALRLICLKNDTDKMNGPLIIEYANADERYGLVQIRRSLK